MSPQGKIRVILTQSKIKKENYELKKYIGLEWGNSNLIKYRQVGTKVRIKKSASTF